MEILCSLFISFRLFRSLHSSILFLVCCQFRLLFIAKLSNAFDNVVLVVVVVVVGMFKV